MTRVTHLRAVLVRDCGSQMRRTDGTLNANRKGVSQQMTQEHKLSIGFAKTSLVWCVDLEGVK